MVWDGRLKDMILGNRIRISEMIREKKPTRCRSSRPWSRSSSTRVDLMPENILSTYEIYIFYFDFLWKKYINTYYTYCYLVICICMIFSFCIIHYVIGFIVCICACLCYIFILTPILSPSPNPNPIPVTSPLAVQFMFW